MYLINGLFILFFTQVISKVGKDGEKLFVFQYIFNIVVVMRQTSFRKLKVLSKEKRGGTKMESIEGHPLNHA
jgi:hypothetical protein